MEINSCELVAALDAAALGFKVFPVRIQTRGNGKAMKIPATANGFYDASNDVNDVNEMFVTTMERYPPGVDILIGVRHEDLTIIDVDGAEGFETLDKIIPVIPEVYAIVTTRSGGKHYYVPHDSTMPDRRQIRWMPGIDILTGPNGFTIIPPSKGYTWERGDLSTIARGYGL